MRGAEIRGVLVVAAIVVAIVVAWTRIENREAPDETVVAVTTTATSATTLPLTTTTTVEQAGQAICERSEGLMGEIFLEDLQGGDEEAATRLALAYWTDMLDLVTPEIRLEVVAVVDYYRRYLEVGAPLDFDTERIIVDGDKERWQQLITRPARGLRAARSLVAFLCGVELPDQFRMDADDFDELEDELLDDSDFRSAS